MQDDRPDRWDGIGDKKGPLERGAPVTTETRCNQTDGVIEQVAESALQTVVAVPG